MILAKRLVPTVLACAIVSACSNGGGSSSTTPTPNPSPLTTSYTPVEGVVAKGIVRGATVKAYILTANGERGAEVGSGTTDDDGGYRIEIDPERYVADSPIILVQSGGRMLCDVRPDCGGTAYGQEVTLANDVEITGVIPPVQTTTSSEQPKVTGHITPFTHMAAERVKGLIKEGQPLSSSLVTSAQSEISNLFGFDVASVAPVNVLSESARDGASEAEKSLMTFLAAIGEMAYDAEFNGIQDVIKKLGEELADGQITNRGTSNGVISLKDITNAAKSQLEQNDNLSDPAGTVTAVEAKALSGEPNQIIDPEPNPNAGITDLEKGKALVATMRTWLNEVQRDEENALIKPSKEFTQRAYDSFAVMDAIETVGPTFVDAVTVATKVWADEDGEDGTYQRDGFVVTLSDGGDTVAITGEDGHGGELNVKGSLTAPANRTQVSEMSGSYYGTITRRGSTIVVPQSSPMTLVAKFRDGQTINLNTEDNFANYKNKLDYMDVNAPALRLATTGTGVEVVNFDGAMNGKFKLTNRLHEALGGKFYWPYPVNITINGTYTNASGDSFQGLLNANLPADKNQELLDIDEAVDHGGETASNYAYVEGNLNFDIQIGGLPQSRITLTGSRDTFKSGEANGRISWNQNAFIFDVEGVDSSFNFNKGTVVFEDLGGAKMTLNYSSKTTGNITVNGNEIGTISHTPNAGTMVRYTDNTTESLY